MSMGRLPVRSDSQPTSGWSAMNTSSARDEISVASLIENPVVLTRYFCM